MSPLSMLDRTGTSQYRIPDRIEAARDDLVQEFLADPLGRHSDDLQLLLAHLRSASSIPRLVVLRAVTAGRWLVAEAPARRGELPRPLPGGAVGSLADAERIAFQWRWSRLLEQQAEPAP
jgi:hypothetical protein